MNARVAFSVGLLLLAGSVADAATLSGELVNGTAGGPGVADRIELIDVAQGMEPLATVEDVTGSFEIADVPASEAHLLLRVVRGDVTFSQSLEAIDQPVQLEVFEITRDLVGIDMARHHVIFRRDAEHMLVTELFEFENASDPPMTIAADALPMRFGFENPTHGAPQASVGSGEFPITLPVVGTDVESVRAVERPLRPGTTRMFVSYAIEYDPGETEWTNTYVYGARDRRVLVAPPDVQVMVASMIPSESPMEGFAAYSGLPVEPGTEWSVRLAGGTAMAQGSRRSRWHAAGRARRDPPAPLRRPAHHPHGARRGVAALRSAVRGLAASGGGDRRWRYRFEAPGPVAPGRPLRDRRADA